MLKKYTMVVPHPEFHGLATRVEIQLTPEQVALLKPGALIQFRQDFDFEARTITTEVGTAPALVKPR